MFECSPNKIFSNYTETKSSRWHKQQTADNISNNKKSYFKQKGHEHEKEIIIRLNFINNSDFKYHGHKHKLV